jgi:NADPH:quinone reductase-like Zn-dependent oxidoreductase
MRNSENINDDVLIAEPKRKLRGLMKAVQIHEYGGTDKLIYEDVPVPQPAPDEVLIRVHAASVNPVDWKIREGLHKDGIKSQFPFVLGWDVAGIIVETGNLVTHFNHSDRVFARLDIMSQGCYAEYAVTKASYVAHAPVIPLHISAGVPLASQTAWAGLFEVGKLKPGQKVLIHGASGGVGNFAVQLAKIAGAKVIATTSDANVDFVRSLGADEVIDYKKEDFSKKVNNADLVFDTIGGETQAKSWQVLRKGGILVTTLKLDDSKAAEFGVTGKSFMVDSNGARLREIASLINKDMLRVIIDSEFKLEEVKKAHERSESGRARGKIILRIYDTPRTMEE